ncbi:Serine/threonine protein kinase [Handroanthus impetiginosus]|uniref:Serine/threonine protein kinase n=1 Tax=Handroanthus impetiginosus TaxID=429701 RepID=A0A2G9G0W1_9LAMI|nr:Serine/threonine protein kinase [Handroanthus impetiginosus]
MMKVQCRRVMGLLLLLITFMFTKFCDAQTVSYLINCGTNSSVNVDGRRWIGDTSNNNVTLSVPGVEASSTIYNGDPVYEPLYRTARVFTNSLSYTFRVMRGNYFLRLHFHPLAFGRYNANESYFDVDANGLRLLSEFNVPREISNKNSNLVKEYFFPVDANVIVVTFVPSRGSFGFVNAIEVIQGGNELFVDSVREVGANGGHSSLNLSKRGIETMYRLNVGGSSIKPSQDLAFWRLWEMDSSYMINSDAGSIIRNRSDITYATSNEAAPLLVYETARTLSNTEVVEKRFNMSWKLEVDPDFDYLVRLHFCELHFDKPNQRIFRIYIDNKTAEGSFDIVVRAGGMNKAYHEDFLDSISPESNHIWIQLGPDTTTGSAGTDALLNGLEIFKLSRNGNLAYEQKKYSDQEIKKTSRSLILWVGIGVGVATVAILAALCMILIGFRNKGDEKGTKKMSPAASLHNENGCGRRFTLTEIRTATNNFDESLVIGVGGFGKVYRGEINDKTLVAIKRSNPQSQQGMKEFETEIEMLSRLRHRHLVSLIGFCDEENEMILVYEFMANGTLRSHLFGSNLPPLSWKQRLEICIGAARGLHYLHTGSERGIIHRDVKTTNILLAGNFVAKMCDFGLSKTGPSLEHTHVSTAVKGSFGYLDPEYFRLQHLTQKSDVYSFGVVLFEVVCARAVIDLTLPKDEISLAEWALKKQREGSLERILDRRLKGKYCQESLMRFGEIAEKCLAEEGKFRPTMGEVLWHLEYALQVHEAWLRVNDGNDSLSTIQESATVLDSPSVDSGSKKTGREEGEVFLEIKNILDPMVVGVDEFSQMLNLQGR